MVYSYVPRCKMFQIKKKGEGPRHPPPIAGFSSFCNLITKDNITDITKKVNQKLSLLYNMHFYNKILNLAL